MPQAPSRTRHVALIALNLLAVTAFVWFCLMHEHTIEERWFVGVLVTASALLLAFATRRPWFALLASVGSYALVWIASALKFAYLEVPLIAPDLYYFITLDTVMVIGRYPGLMWASLATVIGIPAAVWYAWGSDPPQLLHRHSKPTRRWMLGTGFVSVLAIIVMLLWPIGPYAALFGKPMWVAVNDESFITDFVISFHDTQVHIPIPETPPDPSISWTEVDPEGPPAPPASPPQTRKPDVVAVLEESTFDPTILAACRKQSICKHSLFSVDQRTVAHGLLGVHTFGGGTWTSEFALITGLDHTLFGNAGLYAPYNLAPRVQHSVALAFKAAGYRVVALYPTSADFINGRNAYREYGFDQLYDGPENGLDWHAEDPKVFDLFWRLYEKEKLEHPDQPIFFFMLTIHQHGPHLTPLKQLPAPYNKPALPKQLDEFENLCMTNYLERLAQSDAAMAALEKRLLDRPDPSVLMHFGDHQPSFEGVINNMKKVLPADWGPNDHWATYYTIKSNIPHAPKLKYPELDLVFLGGLVQEAAGIPKDGYYVANALLRDRCAGRYHECKDARMVPSYHDYIFNQLEILAE
jgi:phosphoglycerol transferase MdoB-like AlkP superfamily enzyme